MSIEKRITCDDGCGKTRTFSEDLAGTEVAELVWYVPGGTERVQFLKLSHLKRWVKDRQDATPDTTTPPTT